MDRKNYKIYFSGSISGGRQDAEVYRSIIEHLRDYGSVLTEHIGDPALTASGENNIGDDYVYQRDMKWIEQADIFVAEVSNPSLGVGYEIAQAELRQRPVLCLFRSGTDRRLSAMIAGNPSVTMGRYDENREIFNLIDRFFQELASGSPAEHHRE